MIEYKFSYLTNKTKVTIDNDDIKIKTGIVKINLKKQNLKAIYISTYSDYSELILRYDNEKGKIKNRKLIFSNGQPEPIELANYLVENTNCEDLRSLEKKEALKKIKAADSYKVAFKIVLITMFIVPTIIFLPQFLHYFDKGHQTVDISQLIANTDLETSNITVKGGKLIDGIWFQTTTTRRGSSTTTSYDYFPLVPLNWTENDPIRIILKTEELSQEETDNLFSQEEFTGILKNKLWEGGLGSDETDFFKNTYPNYKLTDNILIIDSTDPMYILYIIIYGVVLVILMGVAFYLKRKMS